MSHNQKNCIIVNNTLGLLKGNGPCNEFDECSRRALIFSSGDVERMADASSRARLMMDLKNSNNSSKEFGSYYRGRKTDNNPPPTHFMTSHTATTHTPKRVIPTYPTLMQNITWNPSLETHFEDSQRELEKEMWNEEGEEENIHCRCHKCKTKQCQVREYPLETRGGTIRSNMMQQETSRAFAFKDNITRFADTSTMTSKYTDAYCEVYYPFSRTPGSTEVYISTSDDSFREKVQKQTSSTYPPPILKKLDCDTCCYQTYSDHNKNRVTVRDDAARDNDYAKLLSSIPNRECVDTQYCPANKDNFVDSESCRKNLYNEGISDSIAETAIPQFVGCPMRLQPTKYPVRKDFSRFHGLVRMSTRKDNYRDIYKEPWIPFAHRENSKYHYDCKESVKKVDFRCDDDCGRHGLVVSSKIPKPSPANRAVLCDRPFGKLPKKLLTSERDIEAFVGSSRSTGI